MNIVVKGTNVELTEALKSYVDEKIGALDKFLDDILEARVELEHFPRHQTGPIYRCEVNLDVPQKHLLRAESIEEDLYAAVDTVIPKLKEQIEAYKGRLRQTDRRTRRFLKSVFAWWPLRRRRGP